MKKRLINLICIFCGLLILCSAIFSCANWLGREEKRTEIFFQYYSIKPASLLNTINEGEVNVFFPIAEEPPLVPPEQQLSVSWTQDDYLRIVNALFQFARDDTLNNGWQLEKMSFSSDCDGIEGGGFYTGYFQFFKIVKTQGKEFRIERIVSIDPLNKFIILLENEYYPLVVDWSGINLDNNLLSASEALQVAESNGGNERRLHVNNACYVDLFFKYGVGWWEKNWRWEVWYRRSDKNLTMLFSADINPHTGKIRP